MRQHQRLVLFDQRGQLRGVEVRILRCADRCLQRSELRLERIRRFSRFAADAEHYVGVHMDEPAIAVVGEPALAGARRQAFDGGVVQA